MPTLRDCIKKHAKLLKPGEPDYLRELADGYLTDGHSAKDAERNSIRAYLDELNGHMDSIYKQAGVERVAPKEAGPVAAPALQQTDAPAAVSGTPPITSPANPPSIQEALRVAGGGEGAVLPGKSKRKASRASQETELRKWSEANGFTQDAENFKREWETDGKQGGAENEVYFDEANQRYVKRNDLAYDGTWDAYFKRINAHNEIFPDTAYAFEGFTDTKGKLQSVVSQPFVKGRPATKAEVEADMTQRGFELGAEDQFENDRFIIGDVGPTNALVDEAGNVRYIDPSIMVKPETAVVATEVAVGRPPVETDAAKIKADRKQYDKIQSEMRDRKDYGNDAYNALWKKSEDIKNRHGGMPPGEVAGGETAPVARTLRESNAQWGVENLPFGETAKVDTESGTAAKAMQALDAAGIPVQRRLKITYGEEPFPTKEQFLKGVNDAYIFDGMDRLKKVRRELAQLGLDVRKAKLPEIDDFDTPAEFYKAANDLESRMRNKGVSMGAALVETGQMEKPFTKDSFSRPARAADPAESPTPRTAEQRLNDAGAELTPLSSMPLAAKLAELAERGVTTYKGKPLADLHGGEASNALGKARRGEPLEPPANTDSIRRGQRGAINPSVLAPLGGALGGGAIGAATTDRLPGESDEDYNARLLRNVAIGVSAGTAGGALLPALSRGARIAQSRPRQPQSGIVDLPTPGKDQGIRQTAEKVIENRSYPEQMRQVLADDPEIIYNKISRKRIQEVTKGATDSELVEMIASPDNNIRIGALIQQANRAAVTPGMEAEGARLMKEVSKNFTAPAQLLGLGNLVESPQAMVQAVEDTLRESVPSGTKVPQMTEKVRTTLYELSKKNIQSEQRFAKAERAARDNYSPETKAAYLSAKQDVGQTRLALAQYAKDILPERYGEIVSKIIKGNLLAPLSFSKNAFGNAAWQGLLRGSEVIATGLDAVYSQITKLPRKMALGNPLPGKEEMQAFGQGVKIAAKELLTGPGVDSYIKSEVQRGFHPLRAMLQIFSGVPIAERAMDRRGIASLPTNSGVSTRVKKFIEATLGIAPEASFRLLNMGDKPVRMAVEQRILSEQANLKGLKGVDREKFMLLPDEATQRLVEQEGLGGVLAQDNKLALKVGKIFDTGLVDLAEAMRLGRSPILEDLNKIVGTLTIPYRQFPANFALTAANFALPPVAFARAALQSRAGNRREALRNMGEGVIGAMFLSAAGYLWDKGLISEPADPRDKKRRSSQYETMGAQRLNLSGLERLRNGEDPTYRRGDDTRDWSTIGPAAASFYVFTKAKSKDLNKAARTGDIAEDRSDLGVLLNVTDAAGFAFDQSFLSGTSAFIDALQDWDNYGDRFIQNTFRAITSTVAPNSLEAFARTKYQFIPEQKGDSLRETLTNVWDYKTMQLSQDERANYKRDLWGNPVTRTQAGQNPYIAQFLDVTKAERKEPDPFKQSLLELYQATRSTDVYPALVTNRLAVDGTTVELTPDDYDMLQDFIGQAREDYAKRIVSDPRFSSASLIPEQKILALNAAYTEGAKLGKSMLMKSQGFAERYPEILRLPAPAGHKSRVISRDTKARGAERIRRNEWGDVPVAP